jgi:hypothetical protein
VAATRPQDDVAGGGFVALLWVISPSHRLLSSLPSIPPDTIGFNGFGGHELLIDADHRRGALNPCHGWSPLCCALW